MQNLDTISARAAAIEEMYQPIFGHPELSSEALRACEDRLEFIGKIYRAVEKKLGRSLRVIDFGCAQGFFSFSLAKLGASVLGVDINPNNIALCQALADEQPDLRLTFRAGLNEQVISEIEHGAYDLVLGLSVFHHTVHQTSLEFVQRVLAVLAQKTVGGIYEVALADEPLHWAAKQAKDPRDLLSGYAFVHELARNPSHLSDLKRPLFIASNYFWLFNNEAELFTSWKQQSHPYAGAGTDGTRRYFFSETRMAKLFTWRTDEQRKLNQSEHSKETAFLSIRPSNFPAPRLLEHGVSETEAWVVRELIPGEILLDKMLAKTAYDTSQIVRDVISQLAALERSDWHHNDMRPYNVLISNDGRGRLIDFGAVSHDKNTGTWPYNPFLCLMIFIYDTIAREASMSNPTRTVAFNPDNFPEPYRSVFWKLFSSTPDSWSFNKVESLLAQPAVIEEPYIPSKQSMSLLLKTMEEACSINISMAMLARQQLRQAQQNTQT